MAEGSMNVRCAEIDSALIQGLAQLGPCTFDELVRALPEYTWKQVFTAVDRLSRSGVIRLRHPTLFEYVVTLEAPHTPTGRAENF
jgi:hypothetical protein